MDISVNVIRQGEHILVAACDADLLGKKLKFGKINFEVSNSFYGGMIVSVEEALSIMREGTTVNMVGSTIVQKAIEKGLIHPQAILDISGVPHAQTVRL